MCPGAANHLYGIFFPDKLRVLLNAIAVASHCPHRHNTKPAQQMLQQHTANICYSLRCCDVFYICCNEALHPFFPRSVFFFYRTR